MKAIDLLYKGLSGNSPDKVHPVVKQKRMDLCNSCPELVFKNNCKLCGCFVKVKTGYKAESCPKKKW